MKMQWNQVEFIKWKYCTVDKIINASSASSEHVFFFVIFLHFICQHRDSFFFLCRNQFHTIVLHHLKQYVFLKSDNCSDCAFTAIM